MKKGQSLQDFLFEEISDNKIFSKATDHGMNYLRDVFDRNVFPGEEALARLATFDEKLNDQPVNAVEILDKLHQYGSPATVAQMGGRYFGFVCGSSIPAGLAAKNLASFWDQNSAMYVLSPLASKLETVVESWIKDIFNLRGDYAFGFVSGSSLATFCALAAARYSLLKKQDWDLNRKGLQNSPDLRIVTGKHAHSTVLKAVSLLGLGTDNIEWVEVDDQGGIRADLIPRLDGNTILILQAGNVNSGSFDDFSSICGKAKKAGAWIHIDGAFGLWAAASSRLSFLTEGMEKADSFSVDGHKTLNTPYDNGILICRDKAALQSALHMSGSYIIKSADKDGMFHTPEMSRRARIVDLWATMKSLGKSGIAELVETMSDRACLFKKEIQKIDGFSVLNEISFNQVLVTCKNDELTEKTIKKIQDLRVCWVGGSQWFGRKVIRVSISSWATTEKDIQMSVNSFKEALEYIREEEK